MDYVDRLTALREDHDLNQTQISEIIGTTQTAVSKYELRQRKYQVEDIIALAKYYNVSADYILGLPEGLPHPKR